MGAADQHGLFPFQFDKTGHFYLRRTNGIHALHQGIKGNFIAGQLLQHRDEAVQLLQIKLQQLVGLPDGGNLHHMDRVGFRQHGRQLFLAVTGDGYHHQVAVGIRGKLSNLLHTCHSLHQGAGVTGRDVLADGESGEAAGAELHILRPSRVDQLLGNHHAVGADGLFVRGCYALKVHMSLFQYIHKGRQAVGTAG